MLPPELLPTARTLAHGIGPTKIQLPCAHCYAILNAPHALSRFNCPQCKVDLAVDLSKIKYSTPPPEEVNEKDPAIIKLQNKPLTWYEDRQQILGKDKATREHVEVPGDVVEELDKEEAKGTQFSCSTGDFNATNKRNKKLKCQDVFLETVEKMYDSLNGLIKIIVQNLGLMTQRIDYDQDLAKSRRNVYGIIDNIGIFTDEEKIMVAAKIVSNPTNVDLFLSLSIEMKKHYVTMTLAGQI